MVNFIIKHTKAMFVVLVFMYWALFGFMFWSDARPKSVSAPFNWFVQSDETLVLRAPVNKSVNVDFQGYCNFAVIGQTFHAESSSRPEIVGWIGPRFGLVAEVPTGVSFHFQMFKDDTCKTDSSDQIFLKIDESGVTLVHQGDWKENLPLFIPPTLLTTIVLWAYIASKRAATNRQNWTHDRSQIE